MHFLQLPEIQPGLGHDNFQLVTAFKLELGVRFRTNAHPVDTRRRWCNRTVRLDCNRESSLMQCDYEGFVQLEQRLAASANNERRAASGPAERNSVRERRSG